MVIFFVKVIELVIHAQGHHMHDMASKWERLARGKRHGIEITKETLDSSKRRYRVETIHVHCTVLSRNVSGKIRETNQSRTNVSAKDYVTNAV